MTSDADKPTEDLPGQPTGDTMTEESPAGPSTDVSRAGSAQGPSLKAQREKLDFLLHVLAVWYTVLAIVLFASLTAIAMIFAELRDIRQVEAEREQVKRQVLGQTTADPLFVGTKLNQTCIRDLNKLVNDFRESMEEQLKMFEEEYKKDRDQKNKRQLIVQEILQPYDEEAAKKAEEALLEYIQSTPGFRTAVYFYAAFETQKWSIRPISAIKPASRQAPHVVSFNDVRLNIGSCLNRNGYWGFRAKYRGLYLFEVHVMSQNNGEVLLTLEKQVKQPGTPNNHWTNVFAVYVKEGFGENTASNSAVVRLEKDDSVQVWSHTPLKNIRTNTDYTTPVTTFSGAMLYMCEDDEPCDVESDLLIYKRI